MVFPATSIQTAFEEKSDAPRERVLRSQKEVTSTAWSRFYKLVLQTRRRHGLPPQPMVWFHNLVNCLGESVRIRLAWKGGLPIAGLLTLQQGKSVYYKYGASIACFHNLWANALFVLACDPGCAIGAGLEQLDLGRSDCNNAGLVTFKDRWGSARSVLHYLRSPVERTQPAHGRSPGKSAVWREWPRRFMPDRCLTALGALRLLYSHID